MRLIGLDVARAWAIFGMVVVNFSIVINAKEGEGLFASLTTLLQGRAVATFVVLAGIGLSLLSAKGRVSEDLERRRTDRGKVLKRALFLFVCGTAYTPLWPADILHFYGVYLALAALLLFASNRVLLMSTVVAVFAFPVLLGVLDYEAEWDFETLTYNGLWTLSGFVKHLLFNGFHPLIPWVGFLLAGMVLGRVDLRSSRLRMKLFGACVVVAIVVETLSRWAIGAFALGDAETTAALLGAGPLPPMPQYLIAGGATAIAFIMLCLEITQRLPERLFQPLVVTGQMALTHYAAHVLLGMGALEEMGWLAQPQTAARAWAASAVFFVAAIMFSLLWRRVTPRGPLEWVMRKLCG